MILLNMMILQNGESVMIKVATGGDSKTGEQVMVLL